MNMPPGFPGSGSPMEDIPADELLLCLPSLRCSPPGGVREEAAKWIESHWTTLRTAGRMTLRAYLAQPVQADLL